MNLLQPEMIRYLASVIFIARKDKQLSPKEIDSVALVQSKLGAKKGDLTKAYSMAESPQFRLQIFPRFATNVQLLEDMILLALVDGGGVSEDSPIHEFAASVGVSGSQVERITSDVKAILTLNIVNRICLNCRHEISSQAKFCPECGTPVAEAEKTSIVNVEYEIPAEGISIEFAESTASGFPEAVKMMTNAPASGACVRARKTWYFASWPLSEISEAAKMAECLKGMRNRRVYVDGAETTWDDVFGFIWCAEHRNTAFKPLEYCFGLDEKRLNIWGCKQARMEWAEWAHWFSYGSFKKKGIIGSQMVFVLDKARIKHELQTNLYRFRYCPYMNTKLMEAVVDILPSEIEPSGKGPWTYRRDYSESPGAIKIRIREEQNGYTYIDEYYSSGVAPKSLSIGIDILKTALKKSGFSHPDISGVLEYKE